MKGKFALSIVFITLLSFSLCVKFNLVDAEASDSEASILSHSAYLDSLGYYHVVGEVKNVGNFALHYVKIVATFYDATNAVVGTDSTFTELDVLLPQRKSPFDLFLYDTAQSMKVHHYSLIASYSITSSKTIGLSILSDTSYTDHVGYRHIVGEIKNIGSVKATYVKIIATCYDEAGTVVASDFTFSDPMDVDPGQRAPFEIMLDKERTPFVSTYELTAESSQYALIPESALFLILPTFMAATLLVVIFYRRKHG